MKKILLFTPNYSLNSGHNQTFISTRINQYIKNNINVEVVTIQKKKRIIRKNSKLKVRFFENYSELDFFLNKNIHQYDKIFINFVTFQFIKIINKHKKKIFIWIHGIEAQKWKWYLFDIFNKPFWFLKHIVYNLIQLRNLKIYLTSNKNIKLIFVSKWMKEVFTEDLGINLKKHRYAIIPNPIDHIFFDKTKRDEKSQKNILIIKNFASKKYAGDITVNYLLKLSKYKIFKKYNFTIVGKGKILDKNLNILKFKNVKVKNQFYSPKNIFKFHKDNSIFFYLTRMDAQSVTLSEALCSGMVCISSNNTAIPEFISNKTNGFLINDFKQFRKILIQLNQNKNLINKISRSAIKNSKFLKPENIFKMEKKFIKL